MFRSTARQSAPAYAALRGWSALWRRLLGVLGCGSVNRGALEHLGSLPLTAQSSLALVRLNKETLLLGITPQGITLLTKDREETAGHAGTAKKKSAPRPRLALTETAAP